MKALIKRFLARGGYAVVRSETVGVLPGRYASLLNAFADEVRNSFLPSLPGISPAQACLVAQLCGISEGQALYLLDALNSTLALDGEVCEFGVAQGATSALLAETMRATTKRLWLFDSFEGLPAPSEKDILQDDVLGLNSIERYKGQMSYPETHVRGRLGAIGFPDERIEIVKGFVEKTLDADRTPKQVAFAFVDLDFYEPIRTVLQYLDRTLVPQGIIVVHDYGFLSTGVKTAVDEFLASRGERYRADFPNGPIVHCCSLRKIPLDECRS